MLIILGTASVVSRQIMRAEPGIRKMGVFGSLLDSILPQIVNFRHFQINTYRPGVRSKTSDRSARVRHRSHFGYGA